jgi:hypothetical protein
MQNIRDPSDSPGFEGEVLLGSITPSALAEFVEVCRSVDMPEANPDTDEVHLAWVNSAKQALLAAGLI